MHSDPLFLVRSMRGRNIPCLRISLLPLPLSFNTLHNFICILYFNLHIDPHMTSDAHVALLDDPLLVREPGLPCRLTLQE